MHTINPLSVADNGKKLRLILDLRCINKHLWNKILTVTDCYGWETAQAYLADPIASNSEDEKKLKKARKEAKANKEEKGELLSQNEGRILAANGHLMVQMPRAVSQPVTTASLPHAGAAGGQGTSPAVAG